ncbi:MAG: methyltransferase domain-containing protein [Candidatus Acidiferrales bacterium]
MSEIISHYEKTPEDPRLLTGWGPLELARTQELILRHLPAAPRKVLDVGGGSGVYSAWLGSLNYETHLVDIVPTHVERARTIPGISSAEVGDARKLANPNASFDAVLFLGPLYHLTDRNDRLAALREARRVLKPGGLLFAAAISRFASLLNGLVEGAVDDPRFVAIVEQDLKNGQHRNTTDNPNYFTTAFFHRPEELRTEILDSGCTVLDLAAIEGPGWLATNFQERWSDQSRREQLLQLIRQVERDPALLALSLHILAIARIA